MAKSISISDYSKDGDIDWKAYRQAQVDNGDLCRTCGHFILFPSGHPEECSQCKRITLNDPLDHEKFIRCPKCGDTWDPFESDDHEVFSDGDHTVTCPECSHEFDIVTEVSYSFESPAMVEEQHEEDDGEEDPEEEDDGEEDPPPKAVGTGEAENG